MDTTSNMLPRDDTIKSTFRVLRSCKSLTDLDDEQLLSMTSESIDAFSKPLYDYDASLPKHLNTGKPKWIPMTCATIHISTITSQFDMDDKEALCFMKHVHLLYRFDDFLETIPELYGFHDLAGISDTIHDAFKIFDSSLATDTTASDSESNSTGSSNSKHDSFRHGTTLDCLAGQSFLEHDVLELIELLHETPVRAASDFNQRWYTAECRRTLLAMVQQLVEKSPGRRRPGDGRQQQQQRALPEDNRATLRTWLHSTGADSVGTNYQFAFLACLVSARDRVPCWQGLEEQYLAQTFAQHVSASWRIWNDLGGRVRDEEEGAFTSCSFAVGGAALDELASIADFEAACIVLVQQRLVELSDCYGQEMLSGRESRRWRCLEFFRKAVHLSGEIYLAGDPTRSYAGCVVLMP
jgi:hypothetical protein